MVADFQGAGVEMRLCRTWQESGSEVFLRQKESRVRQSFYK